jgi:DNA (cytosine-5)-methyltransferase 3A
MNVLSLFDGMSCGQIALERAGIKVNNYYASEIDKHAIKVTQANYPDTVQLGDVTQLKKRENSPKIDLLIGGSPCQGFSFAGKQLNFEDPRSKLFFEYVRLLKELKPKYFILENVRMKKESQDIISKYLGVEPIVINSNLVSAQNRHRLYWTNIPGVSIPEDKGILLKDILQKDGENTTIMSDRFAKRQEGRKCLVSEPKDKSASLSAMEYVKNGRQGDYILCNKEGEQLIYGGAIRGRYDENGKIVQKIECNKKEKSNSLTTVQKDNIVIIDGKLRVKEATKKGYAEASPGEGLDLTFPTSKTRRGRLMKEKSNCLTAANYEYGIVTYTIKQKVKVRKHEVDTEGLKVLLSSHKNDTIKNISEKLKVKKTKVDHWFRKDKSFAIPDPDIWPELKKLLSIKDDSFDDSITIFEEKDNVFEMSNRVYDTEGKSPTMLAGKKDYNVTSDKALTWRKLTPIECERLQTVPDNYTNHVSNTQRYKMLGNGWTVDVISHILKGIK